MDFALQELLFFAEILGPDRPEIAKCLENAARNPALIPDYKRHFLRLLKKEGHELHDLPAFGRLSEKDKRLDGILLGHIAEK